MSNRRQAIIWTKYSLVWFTEAYMYMCYLTRGMRHLPRKCPALYRCWVLRDLLDLVNSNRPFWSALDDLLHENHVNWNDVICESPPSSHPHEINQCHTLEESCPRRLCHCSNARYHENVVYFAIVYTIMYLKLNLADHTHGTIRETEKIGTHIVVIRERSAVFHDAYMRH